MSRTIAIVARLAAALVLFVGLGSLARANEWQINDAVQVYMSGGWYDAVVTGKEGAGADANYRVQFSTETTSRGPISESYIRARPDAQGNQITAAGDFMPGIYQCFAQGQYFFLSLGSDLAYQQTEPSIDPGLYELDNSTGTIRFTTGPYSIGQWTAEVHNAADQHGVILHADQDYDCKAAR